MKCSSGLSDLLAFYAAGSLGEVERVAVARHLGECGACRAELALWLDAGAAVQLDAERMPLPSPRLIDSVLASLPERRPNVVVRAWQLLLAQVPLLRPEIWWASAFVMAMGCFLAVLRGGQAGGAGVVEVLAPLVAAAGVALIYGPENDPALELALSTPTSPRQVLLARLALVFGYDLVLSLVATLGLATILPTGVLGAIVWTWLGPMTFLSSLALVLSLAIGTSWAVTASLVLWWSRWFVQARTGDALTVGDFGHSLERASTLYAAGWDNPGLTLILGLCLLAVAFWLVGKPERHVTSAADFS